MNKKTIKHTYHICAAFRRNRVITRRERRTWGASTVFGRFSAPDRTEIRQDCERETMRSTDTPALPSAVPEHAAPLRVTPPGVAARAGAYRDQQKTTPGQRSLDPPALHLDRDEIRGRRPCETHFTRLDELFPNPPPRVPPRFDARL